MNIQDSPHHNRNERWLEAGPDDEPWEDFDDDFDEDFEKESAEEIAELESQYEEDFLPSTSVDGEDR